LIAPDVLSEARRNFRDLFWRAVGYEPTRGEFPIYDLDNKLVTTSYGQAEIHECNAEVIQITGGERAGKSKVTAMESVGDILTDKGLMWIVGPDYEQGKAEFTYLNQGLQKLGVLDKPASTPEHGGQSLVTTWGFRIQTKSGQDLEALASFAPDIILLVEANQMKKGVLDKAYGRAAEKRARILMSGTIEKSEDWYVEKWAQWQGPNAQGARSFSLPTWSNSYIFPGGRQDPGILKAEARLSPEVFLERFAAIPCKPSGLVFKEFGHKKHVRKLEYNDNLPIELAIDPGTTAYAIEAIQWETLTVKQWLERAENEALLLKRTKNELEEPLTKVYVIDEVYHHDVIVQDVLPEVQAKPWFKNVRGGVIDIAAKQRHANKSQQQIWMEETRIPLRMAKIGINTGIGVYRLRLRDNPLIGEPLIQFDHRLRPGKNDIQQALGVLGEHDLYKWPNWVAGSSEKIKPIDANNHAVKAIAYWEYDMFGAAEERDPLPPAQTRSYF